MKTLLVLLVCAGSSWAQSFAFATQDTVMFTSPTVADVIASGYLTNTSSAPISLSAHRIVNVQDTTWSTQICMEQCVGPTIDSADWTNIPAGEGRLFLLHFAPTTVPSSNNVLIKFVNVADTSVSISQWFHMATNSPSHFTSPQENKKLYFGENDSVAWTSPLTGDAILSVSTDAGESWTELTPRVPLSDGRYVWTPDPVFINTAKLRLRVGTQSYVSDKFSVTARFFSPTIGEQLKSGTAYTTRWSPGVAGTGEFGYSTNNGASYTLVTSGVNVAGGTYTWKPPAAMNSTAVRVRLRSSSWSFSSDPFTVTPASAVGEITPTSEGIIAAPNPAHDVIAFSSASSAIEQIEIFDMLGRAVSTLDARSDRQTVAVSVSQLPAGVYAARIRSGNRVHVIPFSVTR